MITTDVSKGDPNQPLLSREQTQEDAPPSYSAANGAGPSAGSMTYAQVASQPPPAQAPASTTAHTQPSYQASTHPNQYAQYSATPPAAHRPVHVYNPAGPPPPPPHEPAWKRFLKAFGVALLVWILVGILFSSIADRGIPRTVNRLRPPTSPVAADGFIQACYGNGSHDGSSETDGRWSEVPSANSRSRRASIDLDLGKAENAALYLLTRGGSAACSVTFEEGSSAKAGVRVTVDYDPWIYDFPKVWQVCVLERGAERGVGIYFPDFERGSSTVAWHKFDVHAIISLPKTRIAKFSTDTRNYAHILNAAEESTFETLILRGTNTRIEATTPVAVASLDASTTNGRVLGSYSGTTLTLVTTNDEITGIYNASSSLVLKTTYGAVQTDTSVGHTLSITTSNAPIHGPVSFIGKAGAFDATLHTTNGPLDVLVPNLPLGATLSLNARTSNDVANLILPASYEGRIWQSTSNSGTPKLEVAHGLRDPAGNGREYIVTSVSSGKKEREDRVGWGNERGSGHVRLTTTNGAEGVRIVQEP